MYKKLVLFIIDYMYECFCLIRTEVFRFSVSHKESIHLPGAKLVKENERVIIKVPYKYCDMQVPCVYI